MLARLGSYVGPGARAMPGQLYHADQALASLLGLQTEGLP